MDAFHSATTINHCIFIYWKDNVLTINRNINFFLYPSSRSPYTSSRLYEHLKTALVLYKLAKTQKDSEMCTISHTKQPTLCAAPEFVRETRCNTSRQQPRNVWDDIENKHLTHGMGFHPSARIPESNLLPAMPQGRDDRLAPRISPPARRNIWDSLDELLSAHACCQIDARGRDDLPSASIARPSKLRDICDVSGGKMMKARRVTKKRKRNPYDNEATQAMPKKSKTASIIQ